MVSNLPPASPAETNTQTFKVLSLCGGGLSGAFSAGFLKYVEENTGKRVVDHFDLITGTSTGGIIALGLGLGLSASELFEFYRHRGHKIFPQNPTRTIRWLHRTKYSEKALNTELQDVFQNRLLAESRTPLVIPSYDLALQQVRLFKTRHNIRFNSDHQIPAWKIARATSAAPTYLPACREIDNAQLIDGGVWANNPVMVGVTEAIAEFYAAPNSIRVLSLGTTMSVKKIRSHLDRAGVWGWKKDIADTFSRAQSSGVIGQTKRIIGSSNLLHIDPSVADGEFQLDKSEPDKAAMIAQHHARHELPRLQNDFLNHRASLGVGQLRNINQGRVNG